MDLDMKGGEPRMAIGYWVYHLKQCDWASEKKSVSQLFMYKMGDNKNK